MEWSAPISCYPETPTPRHPLRFVPLNSSPLASSPSPTKSSPLVQLARRRSQYKANYGYVPTTPSKNSSGRRSSDSSVWLRQGGSPSSGGGGSGSAQKEFLRERFKMRCFERATQAREKAVRNKRYEGGGHPSSDDAPMDDEEDEDDDMVMQDELFRRIMANVKRKEDYSYRLSYDREVGSSFDPDMEDPTVWEESLASNSADPQTSTSTSTFTSTIEASSTSTSTSGVSYEDYAPEYLDDDEELEAYAEEFAKRAVESEFEGIPLEQLLSSDDFEDEFDEWCATPQPSHPPNSAPPSQDEDMMDVA